MSRDGAWGGHWITHAVGPCTMLNIEIALVSSLGENGLRIFSHDDSWSYNTNHNLSKTALLGHEVENIITASSICMCSRPYLQVRKMKILRSTLRTGTVKEKQRIEEICPKCSRKFECLSARTYANDSGIVQYYADDCRLCDACCKDEEWYKY